MATPYQQPEDGIHPRDHSTGPQTPPAKRLEYPQLVFQQYRSPGTKSIYEKRTTVDHEIRALLTKNITNVGKEASYLYVFTSPEAEGYYKVGRAQITTRRTGDQKRCYKKLQVLCHLVCPNAKLFEKVVHAEFLWSRRKHSCERCTTHEHTEWIQAPLDDILDSVTAWSTYARWLYKYAFHIDDEQRIPLPDFSPRADRWTNWAAEKTTRWMEGYQSRMAPTSGQYVEERTYETKPDPQYGCGTRPKDGYFLDSAPGLSDSPGSTPGSGGIRDPLTPPTPTPAGRGPAMDEYTRKQRNALWTSEEEADWDYATAKPTARPLFTNRRQRPSDKGRRSLCAEDPAIHASLTEGCSKNGADRGTESRRGKKGYMHGISDADINEERWKFMKEMVAEVLQDSKAGHPQAFGTIYLLSLESAKGLYRVCCRSGNRSFSPEKECCDSATRFHNIPNFIGVKQKLLTNFKVLPPDPECGRCSGKHKDWIEIPDRDVTTSIELPKAPVNPGGPDVHGHDCELSNGVDSRSGVDAVAEMQKNKTAVEDVPINFPDGKANSSIGRLGEMIGKPTVATEQQAPGLLDIGLAAARGIISGLF